MQTARLTTLMMLVVASMATPIAAGAGTDLGTPPTVTYGCESIAQPSLGLLPSEWVWGIIGPPRAINGCTYVATGAEAIQAPAGGGFATAARVRVGPTTGTMRISVLRATRSGFGFQCCTLSVESANFVPAANAVTTVPLHLPMRHDLNAAFGETVDYLALTVIGRGVPIPAIATPGTGSQAFFPELIATDAGATSAGVAIVPMLNADTTACGAKAATFDRRVRAQAANICTGLDARLAPGSTIRKAARSGVLHARCTLGGAGTCSVTARVSRALARSLGLTVSRGASSALIGSGKKTFTGASTKDISMKLSRGFMHAIAHRRKAVPLQGNASATVTDPLQASSDLTFSGTLARG